MPHLAQSSWRPKLSSVRIPSSPFNPPLFSLPPRVLAPLRCNFPVKTEIGHKALQPSPLHAVQNFENFHTAHSHYNAPHWLPQAYHSLCTPPSSPAFSHPPIPTLPPLLLRVPITFSLDCNLMLKKIHRKVEADSWWWVYWSYATPLIHSLNILSYSLTTSIDSQCMMLELKWTWIPFQPTVAHPKQTYR